LKYVTLHPEVHHPLAIRYDSGKWFWLSIFVQVTVAGKKAQQRCAPAEENSVINMI
jgi:hypothetical protein